MAVNVNAQSVNNDDIPFDKINSGSLYFKRGEHYSPALTQESDYKVNVNGLLAQVSFTQTFKNSSDEFLEAVYVFPLVDDASVSSMMMEIGERRIVGNIKEKRQAEKIYTKAKQQGKKVSLVSQQRPNLFTTKLANIAPNESIKISLTYTQSIRLTTDTHNNQNFTLRLPLTLTPRYIPNENHLNVKEETRESALTTKVNSNGWAINNISVPDASEITPFQTRLSTINQEQNAQQLLTVSVRVNGGLPLANVTSLYHKIIETNQGSERLITLANKSARLDQDFVLQWQLAQGNTPKAAFFQQTDPVDVHNNYQYGLLMLMPPKAAQEKLISKEVIYIIDTSGSMGGVAIKQAKQSLIKALSFLKPADTFNIIAFNDKNDSVFSLSRPANLANINHANHWITTLDSGGGTNMYPAIKQALTAAKGENLYRQVIFITDGSVGNEAELLTLIDTNLATTRLHTIGIGSAPNGYFMSEAAKVGRGTYRYIGSINEVNDQMTQLFSQISKPLMKNIELLWPEDKVEIFPKKIPDLYAGQPLLISARWLKTANPDNSQQHTSPLIKITGQLADLPWQEHIEVINQNAVLNDELLNNGVAQWWAKNKIDHLLTLHRRSSSETKPMLEMQITQLALQHQLLSPYTSFIAIEENITREQSQALKTHPIKNLMPKGSTQAIPLANTALGVAQFFYLGLFFMITGIFMHLAIYTRNGK